LIGREKRGFPLGFPLGLFALFLLLLSGCTHSPQAEGTADLIWGKAGITDGRLQKPRAVAIDANDRLYIVVGDNSPKQGE
jgi:hypothetical protein